MNSDPGTYILILGNPSRIKTRVGRLGRITLDEGYYLYVGSAFGPGGVRARVSRHFRESKPRYWHIDYLSDLLEVVGVWYTHHRGRLEHHWARILSEMTGMSAVRGFGCSDCGCFSHLFHTRAEPDFANFSDLAARQIGSLSRNRIRISSGSTP